MQNRALRVVLRELPQPVISRTDRGATVLRCRHDVDVFEARLTNNPLVSNTVQSHSTGVTKILATAPLANVLDQVEHRFFKRRLNRTGQRFILTRAVGPALVIAKLPWHRVFEVKTSFHNVKEVAAGKLCSPV